MTAQRSAAKLTERMQWMVEQLQDGPKTAAQLESALASSGLRGLSNRQLRRVLERMGDEIEPALPGWRVVNDGRVYSVQVAAVGKLSPASAGLLVMALSTIERTFGASEVRRLQADLEVLLPDRLRHVFHTAHQVRHVLPTEDLRMLLECWVKGERVLFHYRPNDAREPSERRRVAIASCSLSSRNAQPYLVGEHEGKVKTFRLDRITRVQRELGEGAHLPPLHFDDASELQAVSLRFSRIRLRDAVERLSEERVRQLEITDVTDAWVDVRLMTPLVRGFPILDGQWILGWGASVQVLEPQETRAWWRGELQAMSELL